MAVPDRVLTNHDLEKMVDTSDQWIRERTGMFARRVSDDSTAASDLAFQASEKALAASNVSAEDLDAILVATVSGDYSWPATACILQKKLGAKNAMAFDLSAACSGFVYGLSIAQAYIQSGQYKNILLVGVDLLTKVVDWTDRNTCVLFGDGAGAVVIQPHEEKGVLCSELGADGSAADMLCVRCGGSRVPVTQEALDEKKQFLFMNGREIFRYAVRGMLQSCNKVLERTQKTIDDVSLIIPHQANTRILEAVAQKLGLSLKERFYLNIEKYANTSAATIPIALHESLEEGRLKQGDLAIFVSFGGGLTWGANLVQF
ncbi:MAG: ketoacyl-ACP synthase III [Candidatus Omnitrophica bacterium]|nr:ketoacyl-ACP synthase III [Candidatus Omnitrophota bacterium]